MDAQHGLRPEYRMSVDATALPPTQISTGVARLPAVGATLSGPLAGPNPVPHKVTTCPAAAVAVSELMGCEEAETKFCTIDGPNPPLLAANAPKLLLTICTGDGLLLAPL